jgi:hypothetical protein
MNGYAGNLDANPSNSNPTTACDQEPFIGRVTNIDAENVPLTAYIMRIPADMDADPIIVNPTSIY